jgi:hypothetical protein
VVVQKVLDKFSSRLSKVGWSFSIISYSLLYILNAFEHGSQLLMSGNVSK